MNEHDEEFRDALAAVFRRTGVALPLPAPPGETATLPPWFIDDGASLVWLVVAGRHLALWDSMLLELLRLAPGLCGEVGSGEEGRHAVQRHCYVTRSGDPKVVWSYIAYVPPYARDAWVVRVAAALERGEREASRGEDAAVRVPAHGPTPAPPPAPPVPPAKGHRPAPRPPPQRQSAETRNPQMPGGLRGTTVVDEEGRTIVKTAHHTIIDGEYQLEPLANHALDPSGVARFAIPMRADSLRGLDRYTTGATKSGSPSPPDTIRIST